MSASLVSILLFSNTTLNTRSYLIERAYKIYLYVSILLFRNTTLNTRSFRIESAYKTYLYVSILPFRNTITIYVRSVYV